MSHRPTLVLVPGAWHSATTWNKVTSLLETQQYKCIPVSLPSTAGNESATFGDDVKAVREAIRAETTQGLDVVVVVHSYGGAVGQSAIKDLTLPKQAGPASARDTPGHVRGLIMLASGFGQTGSSFIDGLGGKPPPFWKPDASNGFATLVADCRDLFYHDLPVEEANYWVGKLEKQSLKSLFEGGEDSYSGWKDTPVWYLSTTEDRALPTEAQRWFLNSAREAGGDVTSREVASSHSPMLSMPEETVSFVLEALAAFAG